MPEFFIRANSFAAPFVSDTSTAYQEGDTAEQALEAFAAAYKHPCGLYSADAFESADAFHKGLGPVSRWLCNKEIALQKARAGRSSYTVESNGQGDLTVDGKNVRVENPTGGEVVGV